MADGGAISSKTKQSKSSPKKIRYEPHLVKGEYKDIRGKKEF